MGNEFILGAGESHEIEFALSRAGYTHAEVKSLSGGDFLAKVRDVITGDSVIKPVNLLRHIAEITLNEIEKFVVADHFIANTSYGIKSSALPGKLRIDIDGGIDTRFDAPKDMTEYDIPRCTLNIHRLERAGTNLKIRSELGKEHEKIFLAHLFELISRQPNGEPGFLPTDSSIIGYFRTSRGSRDICSVHAHWNTTVGGAWRISQVGLWDNSFKYDAGTHVISIKEEV